MPGWLWFALGCGSTLVVILAWEWLQDRRHRGGPF